MSAFCGKWLSCNIAPPHQAFHRQHFTSLGDPPSPPRFPFHKEEPHFPVFMHMWNGGRAGQRLLPPSFAAQGNKKGVLWNTFPSLPSNRWKGNTFRERLTANGSTFWEWGAWKGIPVGGDKGEPCPKHPRVVTLDPGKEVQGYEYAQFSLAPHSCSQQPI